MTLDNVYEKLVMLVSNAGAQVDVPAESETFFTEIVESFTGTEEELLAYVKANLSTWFKCLDTEPEWLQEAEWQFSNGKPMTFVGQLMFSPEQTGLHDATRFSLFWDHATGATKTVIQVA